MKCDTAYPVEPSKPRPSPGTGGLVDHYPGSAATVSSLAAASGGIGGTIIKTTTKK